jgi:hypothetical protein
MFRKNEENNNVPIIWCSLRPSQGIVTVLALFSFLHEKKNSFHKKFGKQKEPFMGDSDMETSMVIPREECEDRKDALVHATKKLEKIKQLLSWEPFPQISELRIALEARISFYSFLLVRKQDCFSFCLTMYTGYKTRFCFLIRFRIFLYFTN